MMSHVHVFFRSTYPPGIVEPLLYRKADQSIRASGCEPEHAPARKSYRR